MTDQEIMHWYHNSKGIEKEILADWLYDHNEIKESNIVRAIGRIEQGKPVKTKLVNFTGLRSFHFNDLIKFKFHVDQNNLSSHLYFLKNDGSFSIDNFPVDLPYKLIDFAVGQNYIIGLTEDHIVELIRPDQGFDQITKLQNVVKIYSNGLTCAALQNDGTIYIYNQYNNSFFTRKFDNIKDFILHNFTYFSQIENYVIIENDNTAYACSSQSLEMTKIDLQNIVKTQSRRNGSYFTILTSDSKISTCDSVYQINRRTKEDTENVINFDDAISHISILKINGQLEVRSQKLFFENVIDVDAHWMMVLDEFYD